MADSVVKCFFHREEKIMPLYGAGKRVRRELPEYQPATDAGKRKMILYE